MPLSARDMNVKQPKTFEKRIVGKNGNKPTLSDKIEQMGVETALFKNETEEPVSIRLDSVDQKYQRSGERGQSEWMWLQPGEQAKVPVDDVKTGKLGHHLKKVE